MLHLKTNSLPFHSLLCVPGGFQLGVANGSFWEEIPEDRRRKRVEGLSPSSMCTHVHTHVHTQSSALLLLDSLSHKASLLLFVLQASGWDFVGVKLPEHPLLVSINNPHLG